MDVWIRLSYRPRHDLTAMGGSDLSLAAVQVFCVFRDIVSIPPYGMATVNYTSEPAPVAPRTRKLLASRYRNRSAKNRRTQQGATFGNEDTDAPTSLPTKMADTGPDGENDTEFPTPGPTMVILNNAYFFPLLFGNILVSSKGRFRDPLLFMQ